jgi:hypothetical protein
MVNRSTYGLTIGSQDNKDTKFGPPKVKLLSRKSEISLSLIFGVGTDN